MAVEHKNLSGAEVHEPKGIATAADGTVYTANGSGSGTWRSPTSDIVGLNEYSLTETLDDISAVSSRVYFRIPVKSEMINLSAVLNGAITLADSILSIYINGILFGDSLTVPFATSGAGVASARSIATVHTLNAGDVVEIRSNGGSDTITKAFIQLRLRAKA